MLPFNNHQTPQEIPADRNHQGPSTSRPMTCYDNTTRSPYCSAPYSGSNAASCQICTKCSRWTRGDQCRLCASPSSLCWAPCSPTLSRTCPDWSTSIWAPTLGRKVSSLRITRWHGVLFSDESRFYLWRNYDGRLRVSGRLGEQWLSRRIDGVEGVSWCGTGSVIITEQHSMFVVAEWMPFTTGITSCDITSFPSFIIIGICTHFSKTTAKPTEHVLQHCI